MTTTKADGSRTVPLYIPIENPLGGTLAALTFQAVTFGVMMRWEAGVFKTPLQLMAELSGQPESVIEFIKHPDIDRVLDEFAFHLPLSMRSAIVDGKLPFARVETLADEEHNEADTARPWNPPTPHDDDDAGGMDLNDHGGRRL
jgi:hypothetical protein